MNTKAIGLSLFITSAFLMLITACGPSHQTSGNHGGNNHYNRTPREKAWLDWSIILNKNFSGKQKREKLQETEKYLRSYIAQHANVKPADLSFLWFGNERNNALIRLQIELAGTGSRPNPVGPTPPPVHPPDDLSIKNISIAD